MCIGRAESEKLELFSSVGCADGRKGAVLGVILTSGGPVVVAKAVDPKGACSVLICGGRFSVQAIGKNTHASRFQCMLKTPS